jgi:hypothetical protein
MLFNSWEFITFFNLPIKVDVSKLDREIQDGSYNKNNNLSKNIAFIENYGPA